MLSVPASPKADSTPWTLPALLHLVHPYALTNLHLAIKHVVLFYSYLRTLSAKQENAQIAKDVLVDLVECSGIDLSTLESLLGQSVQDAQAITGKFIFRCLNI
jgi:hypothetical protein